MASKKAVQPYESRAREGRGQSWGLEVRSAEKSTEAPAEAPTKRDSQTRTFSHLPLDILFLISEVLFDEKNRMFEDMMLKRADFFSDASFDDVWDRQKLLSTTVASCAAVNRQWQSVFEHMAFRNISLDANDIAIFEKCFSKTERRRYVRWIHLRLKSERSVCEAHRRRAHKRDRMAFTNAVRILLSYLSSWSIEEIHPHGITFEISSFFKDGESPEFVDQSLFRRWDKLTDVGNWINTHEAQNLAVPWWAARGYRNFADRVDYLKSVISLCRSNNPLPKVEAVTQFVVARDSTWPMSPTRALVPLLASFPRLRNVLYEPWWSSGDGQVHRDLDHCSFVLDFLGSRPDLKVFTMFQNGFLKGRSNPSPPPFPIFTEALVKAGSHLEELHASFIVEALNFFLTTCGTLEAATTNGGIHDFPSNMTAPTLSRAARRIWASEGPFTWSNLRILTLTSRSFDRDGSQALLLAAAQALHYMPKLEMMEIFGNTQGDNRIFRYEMPTPSRQAQITYYTMQKEKPDHQLLSCWRKVVAAHHCQRHLRVKTVMMQPHHLIGPMAIVKYLKNKERMFAGHPSLASVLEQASWGVSDRPRASWDDEYREKIRQRRKRDKEARKQKQQGEGNSQRAEIS